MIEILDEMGVVKAFFNVVKAIHYGFITNRHIQQWTTKSLPSKIRHKVSLHVITKVIQNRTGSPCHST